MYGYLSVERRFLEPTVMMIIIQSSRILIVQIVSVLADIQIRLILMQPGPTHRKIKTKKTATRKDIIGKGAEAVQSSKRR